MPAAYFFFTQQSSMKRYQIIFIGLILLLFSPFKCIAQNSIPYLKKQGKATQLYVHDEPYLMMGGELGNSSSSSMAYMNQIWLTLEQMNLNTLLVPVYWELIEPKEGQFDFELVDSLIVSARQRKIKLVLLWFGSWKNSMSCYVPSWVKKDVDRFPRAINAAGQRVEILSPFSKNNLESDARAFEALMAHVKAFDEKDNTVVMIQVENEIGMLPDARDYGKDAEKLYQTDVPEELLSYLKKNKKELMPEFIDYWQTQGGKTKGTWEQVFGSSKQTEEVFQAWYFAKYTNEITARGKAQYNLPMYINAALNRIGYAPGEYPSAGPLPHLMDIWRAGAPSVDFLAPDIYFPDFSKWIKLYNRGGNAVFIPEARFEKDVGAKMLYAFGEHDCMGFCPFSIESTNDPQKEPVVKGYALIQQLQYEILKHQGKDQMAGFLLNKEVLADTISLGGYTLIARHDYTLGWSAEAKNKEWPYAGGLIICTAPGEYIVAGSGLVFNFLSEQKNAKAGIESIDEGSYIDGKWVPQRRMNGDQSHQGRHVRIPMYEYSIQKLKLYNY